MYRIYKPIDSDITYAIALSTDGAYVLDSSTKRRTFLSGEYETINQALGVYLLRQFRVNNAWGELSRGIF